VPTRLFRDRISAKIAPLRRSGNRDRRMLRSRRADDEDATLIEPVALAAVE
jgi:hypothetical protein